MLFDRGESNRIDDILSICWPTGVYDTWVDKLKSVINPDWTLKPGSFFGDDLLVKFMSLTFLINKWPLISIKDLIGQNSRKLLVGGDFVFSLSDCSTYKFVILGFQFNFN